MSYINKTLSSLSRYKDKFPDSHMNKIAYFKQSLNNASSNLTIRFQRSSFACYYDPKNKRSIIRFIGIGNESLSNPLTFDHFKYITLEEITIEKVAFGNYKDILEEYKELTFISDGYDYDEYE